MKFTGRFCVRAQGMTMVELAVTAVILALVFAAFFALLSNGLAQWGRFRKDEDTPFYLDHALYEESFQGDIENSFTFKGLTVHGDASSVSFPSSACRDLKGDETGPCLGEVTYAFDRQAGTITRTFRNISDLFTGGAGRSRVLMTGVESWSCSFDYFVTGRNEYLKSEVWPPPEMRPQDAAGPLAVRVQEAFRRGPESHLFTKTYEFPQASR